MAVGDVVNGVTASVTTLDYQPASGVEAVITSWGSVEQITMQGGLFDGTNVSAQSDTSAANRYTGTPPKIFVNNTIYFRTKGGLSVLSYTGIQTK